MKVGDKLLCKKSEIMNPWNSIEVPDIKSEITKDKYYTISKIGEKHIMILTDICHNAFSTSIYSSVSPWYLYDYFYTPQEIRKIKLEKLNDSYL